MWKSEKGKCSIFKELCVFFLAWFLCPPGELDTLLLLRLPKDGEGQEFFLSLRKKPASVVSTDQHHCVVSGTVQVPYRTLREVQTHEANPETTSDLVIIQNSFIVVFEFSHFSEGLPIYLNHLIMLALCCNTFLVVLALFFSINSFAHIYLLHLH